MLFLAVVMDFVALSPLAISFQYFVQVLFFVQYYKLKYFSRPENALESNVISLRTIPLQIRLALHRHISPKEKHTNFIV